jgi:hypothetical protein
VCRCLAAHHGQRASKIPQIVSILDDVMGKELPVEAAVGQASQEWVLQDRCVGAGSFRPQPSRPAASRHACDNASPIAPVPD